ncbi:fungal zn(2)-Cys(6) binuclear cluster domain-containing protein [Rhizoctonia solani AG-1 IA]|uniref:Fungal zn(2)-Cys(6) binuclear cluster domain-containing protein n=1 Tax=Thanatephorus cucumeris (strain AG1-IA) TaxID=983506 RepID=L8WUS6_THACA|nr:fungal zn(2)-Cys(6) binuclear cluster domain-containing protein [Rhizoctonia solani AG-1 IA]
MRCLPYASVRHSPALSPSTLIVYSVKCDLKDVNPRPGETPMCTNCQERGLKCVDEFANVKAVKLLRRGRRLAQVEQVYGPAAQARADAPSTDAEGAAQASSSRTPSCIPKLQPEFFGSPFYRRFHIQRPIVDPTEFSARFYESEQGKPESLGVAGSMICMLLGKPYSIMPSDDPSLIFPQSPGRPHMVSMSTVSKSPPTASKVSESVAAAVTKWFVKFWVSSISMAFSASPLGMVSVSSYPTRTTATVSQVYTLCSLGSLVKSGQGEFVDALVRARIFWYGHVHEGITSGLRGGRLIFEDDDLSSFQITFPSLGNKQSLIRTSITYSYSYRYATAPIRLSSACRQIHAALTGPKAKRKEDVNEPGLKEAWEALSRSWEEFEGLRHVGPVSLSAPVDLFNLTDYCCSRSGLSKQKTRSGLSMAGRSSYSSAVSDNPKFSLSHTQMIEHRRTRDAAFIVDPDVSHEPLLAKLTRLHSIAEGKCQDVAGQIVTLIRRHLGSSFFQYDASLVRDGCFYAGLCLARDSGTEEDIRTCVQALEEMRWAFSKSEERIATLKWAWENRKVDEEERLWSERLVRPDSAPGGGGDATGYGGGMGNPVDGMMRTNSDPTSGMMRNGGEANGNSGRNLHRPPTLTLVEGATVDAAPLTSVSDGSWHTPSSASDLAHSHHNSPSSGPATIMPDKTLMMEPALMNAYPTAHTEMFAGAFTDTTAAGHYADDTPIYGHSMPTHGMGVGMGMAMGAHGMQGTYAHGGAALPSFSAPHYDYYPHSNTSHR